MEHAAMSSCHSRAGRFCHRGSVTMPKASVENPFGGALGKEETVSGRVQLANTGMWLPRWIRVRKYPGQGWKVILDLMELSKLNTYQNQKLKKKTEYLCREWSRCLKTDGNAWQFNCHSLSGVLVKATISPSCFSFYLNLTTWDL